MCVNLTTYFEVNHLKSLLRKFWNGVELIVDTLAGVWPKPEPIVANYKHGWTVHTTKGDKVKIVCILEYQFEKIGEPYYFVQSKKTGVSYHLKESEIRQNV